MSNKMKAKEIRNMNKFPSIDDEWCFQSNEELYEEHLNTNYPDDEEEYIVSIFDLIGEESAFDDEPFDCHNCNLSDHLLDYPLGYDYDEDYYDENGFD